jgi:hypothetical protein
MTIATIVVSDVEGTELVNTNVSYDLEDSDPDGPVTNAGLYGYLVHYLFKTGKINDYVDEVIADLNSLTDSETESE